MKKSICTLLLVISILYIILPADVFPDYIPVLGWFDDMGAVVVAVLSYLGLQRAREA